MRKIKGQSIYWQLNNYNWLHQKYDIEELSIEKIAKILGCGGATVWDALKRANMARRACSVKGEKNPVFGTHPSQATRDKQSKVKIGKYIGDKNPFYRKKHKKETIETIKEKSKGKHYSPKTEFKKGLIPWNKGKHTEGRPQTKASKQKIGDATRERWQDEEYLKRWFKSVQRHPNSIENIVDEILQKNLLNEWKYNGNFEEKVVIGGMIPDFVNVNGKKVVIEAFGDYWHGDKKTKNKWKHTEFGRKAAYSQLGYKCIVLWESDLKRPDAEAFVLSVLKKEGVI